MSSFLHKDNGLRAFLALGLFFCLILFSGDTVRPGLEGIEYSTPSSLEMDFLQAVAKPLMSGMDVTEAMQAWFDGRLLETQNKPELASGLKRFPS